MASGFCLGDAGPDLRLVGFAAGGLSGPQTVNRAELMGTTVLAERTSGTLPVAVDSAYAMGTPGRVDVWSVDSKAVHLDLWGRRQEAVDSRQGQ